jgi:hypothetical protein
VFISETKTVNVDFDKEELCFEDFDNADFLIGTDTAADATADLAPCPFTTVRGAFTQVTAADSPSLSDGTAKPGKSLRYTKNAGEASSSQSTYLYYNIPAGPGVLQPGYIIAPKQKVCFEGNFYFGQTNTETTPFFLQGSTASSGNIEIC